MVPVVPTFLRRHYPCGGTNPGEPPPPACNRHRVIRRTRTELIDPTGVTWLSVGVPTHNFRNPIFSLGIDLDSIPCLKSRIRRSLGRHRAPRLNITQVHLLTFVIVIVLVFAGGIVLVFKFIVRVILVLFFVGPSVWM